MKNSRQRGFLYRLAAALYLILIFLPGQAQTTGSFMSLGNFTPPSPDAAALGRYGEIPVGFSSGIPGINVPLYEIRSRKLSVPLSLSYHASGVKVEDVASVAGLGWVLNAGGAITRNVVGKADESAAGMLNMSYYDRAALDTVHYNSNSIIQFNYLKNISNGSWDSQSDIYDINTPGFTGKFVYDINKVIHSMPVDRQIKITWNSSDSTFKIVDETGVQYYFRDKEYTDGHADHNITAWYTSMIVSADNTDTIRFTYKAASSSRDLFSSQTYSITAPINTSNPETVCEFGRQTFAQSLQETHFFYYRKLLDSVVFSNGFVKFNYADDRVDPVKERLVNITIGAAAGVIKKIELSQTYFVSDDAGGTLPDKSTKRLRLDAVVFKDNGLAEINRYAFTYNTTPLPRYYGGFSGDVPLAKTTAYDLWGYYNGSSSNFLLPDNFRNPLISYLSTVGYAVSGSILGDYDAKSADRYPNPSYTQAAILTKIKYPTGGETQFEYENNRVANNGNNRDYVGGLRVKKITSADGEGQPVVKNYTYGSDGSGIAITAKIPGDFYYKNTTITQWFFDNIFRICRSADFFVTSNPTTAINYYNGAPAFYPLVTEYLGDPAVNSGKTEYTFDYEADSSLNSPDAEKYWNYASDKSWARGLPLETRVFKNTGDGYAIVHKTKNNYSSLGRSSVRVGYLCEQTTQTTNVPLDTYLQYAHDYLLTSDYRLLNYFEFLDITVPFGIKKLSSVEETTYVDNDQHTLRTEYTYGAGSHLYPTNSRTYTSDGGYRDVKIKYPQDKSSIAGLTADASSALDNMVSRNVLNVPVETETYKNTSLLYRDRTDFKTFNATGGIYEQVRKRQVESTGTLDERVLFNSYDTKGNLSQAAKKYDAYKSLLWDYNGAYLSAEVSNATLDNISYTSFEAEGLGNWVYAIANGSTADGAVTGNKAFRLSSSNTITRSGLSSSENYVISFWAKNGVGSSVTLNGAAIGATALVSRNGWTLYQVEKTGLTAITISGDKVIDELRLFPKTAQMNTYTYAPLIGVTSQCDANNRITYYEYDGFARLLLVRDQDKNIIKTYSYKFRQAE